ncbi:MAG: hypothetical protein WA821_19870 [Anaerolineales bacterium]
MSLETIVQVGVGLILAWLMLSMIVMYVQEWFVSRMGLRSKMLETTIYNMLTDPAIAAQFYDHPLIQGLFSGENGEQKPAYIPSQQFVLALFDIVMNAGKESSLLQQEIYKLHSDIDRLQKDDKARAEVQYQLALLAARKALTSDAGQEVLNLALDNVKAEIAKLASVSPALQPAVEQALANVKVNKEQVDAVLAQFQAQNSGLTENPTLDQIRVGVAALAVTQPQLKQALETLLQGVEEYANKGESALTTARVSVEKWFDDSMDRLTGWYRRSSQKTAFIIGIAVAIIINGDTVLLAQQLWRDPGLRLSLVAQAETLVNNQTNVSQPTLEQLSQLQAQFNGLNIPFGWVGTPIALDVTGKVPDVNASAHTCTLAPKAADDVFGFAVVGQCYPITNAPHFNDLTGWVLKLLGLIASGMAAAQGAPFWFDLLKRIINVRSSGANPSEAKTAG